MEQKFTIKENGQFLEIAVLKYAYPDATDDYDANWLDVMINLKAGAFSGKYSAYFQTSDFLALKDDLQKLYNTLDDGFKFSTLEDQLEMDFVGDGLGHIHIDCKAQDQAGIGNTLEFELAIDQTEIRNLIYQLEEILKTFPVK